MGTFIGKAQANTGSSNASSLNLTMPTWTAGKTGVAVLMCSTGSQTPTLTTPSGWTYVTDFIANASTRHYVFYKNIADSDSGATVTASWSASNRLVSSVMVEEGVTYGGFFTPITSTSGATINVPGGTASAQPGTLIYGYGGREGTAGDQPTLTAPSGTSDAQTTTTTWTATNRNTVWGTSRIAYATTTPAATTASSSISLNCRAAVTVYLIDAATNGSVSATAGAASFPSTSPTISSRDNVTVTANGASFPSTSPTIIGAAKVVETPATMTLQATNPSFTAGAAVTVTANGMVLGGGSPDIPGSEAGQVDAVAGAAALPSTNVEVWASYYAYAGEMTLGETAPTVVGTSPNGSVVATPAPAVLTGTFPEVDGFGPPPILVRLKNTDVGNFIDVPRPLPPSGSRWIGLWPRLVLPATQKALLLFEDGRVQEVTSLQGDIYDLADDVIAGGTVWEGLSTSWQAQALAAAGYTLVPVEEA
ncbi:MAG: hypothetical protein AB7U23_12530 [Dehalococcoidia bacterium]